MKTSIQTISRMILSHAQGPIPECKLLVAVICSAAIDAASPQTPRKSNPNTTNNATIRHKAIQFLRGRGMDTYARLLRIRPQFILEMLEDGGYLEREKQLPFFDPVAFAKRREQDDAQLRAARARYYKESKTRKRATA